jgi:hypothetical protein
VEVDDDDQTVWQVEHDGGDEGLDGIMSINQCRNGKRTA